MNRREIKKTGYPLKPEPQSLALKNIKSVQQRFRCERLTALFYFDHVREVIQICDDSFTIGQPPVSVTGHWRILSYVKVGEICLQIIKAFFFISIYCNVFTFFIVLFNQ